MSSHFFARRVSRTWVLGSALLGVLSGIGLAWVGWRVSTTILGLAVILMPLLLMRRSWTILLALGLGLTLGLWRGGAMLSKLSAYQPHYFEKVELIGTVMDDPAYAAQPAQLEFYIGDILLNGVTRPGKIRVRSVTASVLRGDKVSVKGKLYPGFASWQGSLSFAQVRVLEHSQSWLEGFRREFFAGTYSSVSEPQASLGLGFLVGTRGLLPDELTDQLRRTGLSHIVAVSGYNLTILVRLARRAGFKFSKRLAALFAISLVTGFLAIAGGSASIVRASAVVAFALSAWYCGRRISPLILLLLSSALTALINPLFFWFDLGWWLSFAAFFGILIVAPLLKTLLFKKRKLRSLTEILLETTSAQIMTIPLTLTVFGEFSVVALLANLLILPLVPFAMLFSFVAGVGGMLLPAAIAAWLAWPAQILLGCMVELIRLLSRPGWAFLNEVNMPSSSLLLGYSLLLVLSGGMYWWTRKRQVAAFTESVIE